MNAAHQTQDKSASTFCRVRPFPDNSTRRAYTNRMNTAAREDDIALLHVPITTQARKCGTDISDQKRSAQHKQIQIRLRDGRF